MPASFGLVGHWRPVPPKRFFISQARPQLSFMRFFLMNEASDNTSTPPDCGSATRQVHHWHHTTHTMLVECCLDLNPPIGGSRWVKRPIERCCFGLLEISLLRKPIRRYQRIRQALWSKSSHGANLVIDNILCHGLLLARGEMPACGGAEDARYGNPRSDPKEDNPSPR